MIGNDGWESVATDIIGIHDYDDQPERIGRRYGLKEVEALLFKRERPGGRMLVVDGHPTSNHPIVLTEFGGIAFSPKHEGVWGYSQAKIRAGLSGAISRSDADGDELACACRILLHGIRRNVSGGKWTCVCGPDTEGGGGADCTRYKGLGA